MANPDMQIEIKESSARITMLEHKLHALLEILKKEGITAPEEVEAKAKELIEGGDNE